LVAILHPWESGMDNSPAWDAALARVPAAPSTPIKRRDTGHVHADMRPSQADYNATSRWSISSQSRLVAGKERRRPFRSRYRHQRDPPSRRIDLMALAERLVRLRPRRVGATTGASRRRRAPMGEPANMSPWISSLAPGSRLPPAEGCRCSQSQAIIRPRGGEIELGPEVPHLVPFRRLITLQPKRTGAGGLGHRQPHDRRRPQRLWSPRSPRP
jgi:hypothetical protein